MKPDPQAILALARAEALKAETWADFSNFLYDQEEGILARAFPNRSDREQFLASPEFLEIQGLIDAVQERTGLVEGATPMRSGKFVVRVPRSLHSALHAEAKREGVSLNQLVVAKLAVQLSRVVGTS